MLSAPHPLPSNATVIPAGCAYMLQAGEVQDLPLTQLVRALGWCMRWRIASLGAPQLHLQLSGLLLGVLVTVMGARQFSRDVLMQRREAEAGVSRSVLIAPFSFSAGRRLRPCHSVRPAKRRQAFAFA